MAPASHQQAALSRRDDRRAQINPADRAPAAFSGTFRLVQRDNDRGSPGLLFDPPRHDPDNAGMPAFASHNMDRHVVLPGKLFFRRFLNRRFDGPAFLVELRKLRGNLTRLFRIARRQQANAQSGFANTPARVDPWAKRKPQIRGYRRAFQAACVH